MKRALAQRAKEESLPQQKNKLAPPNAASAPRPLSQDHLRHKIPRVTKDEDDPPPDTSTSELSQQPLHVLNEETPVVAVAAAVASSPAQVSSNSNDSYYYEIQSVGSQRVRQRRLLLRSDEETSNSSANDYYLKYQNRALASELWFLQDSVRQLEQERVARRQDCFLSLQALQSLQRHWSSLEQAVLQQQPAGTTYQPDGGGDDVEWTAALARALAAVGGTAHGENGHKKNDVPSELELSHVARNMEHRVRILQEWILKYMRRNGAEIDHAAPPMTVPSPDLKDERILEIATARDDALRRERRTRKNLYRLAAGLLDLDTVLQSYGNQDAAALLNEDVLIRNEVQEEKRRIDQQQAIAGVVSAESGNGIASGAVLAGHSEGGNTLIGPPSDGMVTTDLTPQIDSTVHHAMIQVLRSQLAEMTALAQERANIVTEVSPSSWSADSLSYYSY
jgi:hypothetical protein